MSDLFDGLSLDSDDGLTLDDGGLSLDASDSLVLGHDPTEQKARQEYTGGRLEVEVEAEEEVSEVLQGFKQRAEREDQRFWDAVDSEYWVCLCFQTRDQKEEFLKKLGLFEMGDKYIDGIKAAKKMGVTLESRVPPMPQARPFDREYVDLAMNLDDDGSAL